MKNKLGSKAYRCLSVIFCLGNLRTILQIMYTRPTPFLAPFASSRTLVACLEWGLHPHQRTSGPHSLPNGCLCVPFCLPGYSCVDGCSPNFLAFSLFLISPVGDPSSVKEMIPQLHACMVWEFSDKDINLMFEISTILSTVLYTIYSSSSRKRIKIEFPTISQNKFAVSPS